MERCILLNADYTFLNVVSWKRALKMVFKEKVEVLQYSETIIRCGDTSIPLPTVMKLIKFIRTIYRNRVPFTKKNIMVRDKYECAYCGSRRELTIDHIIPSSRGGKTNFENCITACRPCNNAKGNRTPNEAGMFMKRRAYQPTISEFLMIKMKQLGIDKVLNDLF
jgi:5-methylcytosine-specific restriction endonuclease McrA